MSSHRLPRDLNIANYEVTDPGTGNPIDVDRWNQVVSLEIGTTAETNTLAAPTKAGQKLTLFAQSVGSGGTRVVTVASAIDALGTTTLTFTAADQRVVLESVTVADYTYEWRVTKNEGVAGPGTSVNAIDLTRMRVWDAMATNLPGTAAADDMALITGTLGTDAPTLQGVDFGGTSTDEKCAFLFPLPANYSPGGAVTVRVRGGMVTSIADTTCTVDVECYKQDGDGAVGSDICTTAAQSIRSLTPANCDFTITPTGLVPGDILMIRLAFAGSDVANAAVLIPEIQKVEVRVAANI